MERHWGAGERRKTPHKTPHKTSTSSKGGTAAHRCWRFASASARNAPHVPGPALPNHRLTPGARFAVGTAKVCKTGYSAPVRNVPESKKDRAYARYHLKRVAYAYAYEVDHLVSLELGGSNALANLWPEHYYGAWGARTKDRLENTLVALDHGARQRSSSASTVPSRMRRRSVW